jgi:cold shock CspA family protein
MQQFSYFSRSFMDAELDHNNSSCNHNSSSSSSQPTLSCQYVGVVSSKQKSFGFICSQLSTETFFHKSSCADDLFDSLQPGDAVSFQLAEPDSSRPGKRVAASVTRSTHHPDLESVDQAEHYGRIMKLSGPSQPLSGVLRFIPEEGKVQHLTFKAVDVAESAAELLPGQVVTFKMLTDKRQQLMLEASGRPTVSPHAVHAYKRATQMAPVPEAAMVSVAGV